jgi:hypothetical protein
MAAFTRLQTAFKVLVTRKTEGALLVNGHPSHVTSMGVVTGETHPVCKGHVIGSSLGCAHQVVMTIGAERRIRCFEEILTFRPVRRVACAADTIKDGLVSRCFDEFPFGIRMTAIADPVGPLSQNTSEI